MKRGWIVLVVLIVAVWAVPIAAQAAAAAVDTPLEPGQANESVVSFVWAYASASFLQWWKKSRFGGMGDNALRVVKTGIAVLMAFAGALGVHSSFDAAAGQLTITGLLWPGIWTALGDTVRQYAFQTFAYRTAIEPRSEPTS